MTYQEYRKVIKGYIDKNDIDFTFEIAATDAATVDTIAENITDTIAAFYPTDTDTDRDNLVMAVYDIIQNDHADEIKRGEIIQDIMRIKCAPGVNMWDLYDKLTTHSYNELLDIKRGCKNDHITCNSDLLYTL